MTKHQELSSSDQPQADSLPVAPESLICNIALPTEMMTWTLLLLPSSTKALDSLIHSAYTSMLRILQPNLKARVSHK